MGSKKLRAKDVVGEKEKKPKEEKKKPEIRRETPLQIIRVSGTDLDGGKPVVRAIRKIRGIGFAASIAVCSLAKIDPNAKLGTLSESQMTTLENVIKNPLQFGIPRYLINRRNDPETGSDLHLSASDLDIARRFDIQKYINLRTYRGWRHMQNQPVRGQRTRSTFRSKGKTVGVIKKALHPGKVPSATPTSTAPAKPEKKKK